MAGVLLATLSQVDPGGGDRGPREPARLYERGDPNWMDRVDPPSTPRRAAPPASGKPPQSEAPRQIALAKPATHSWRNVPTIHPSHLTARARGTIGQALRSAAEPAATDRGSMLHACFAQVHWLDDGTWRDGLLENLRQKFPNQPDREEVVAEFARIVRQPMVSAILSRVSYAEQIAGRVLPSQIVFEPLRAVAQNEWPFAVRLDQSVLAGTIDRLVSIYEGNSLIGAEIIEYKTDRLDENDEAEIARQVAAYRPQIDAYRRAVAQWTGLAHPRVLARLLWVGIDRVCEVR
jgi:ATP-dependent exoDNAse (exonuclease V) beta subunit